MLACSLVATAFAKPGVARLDERPGPESTQPLLLWSEPGFAGVNFPVHVARIALDAPELEIVAVAEPAPTDVDKAVVLPPAELARRSGLLLGVNANAFDEGGVLNKVFPEPGRAVALSGVAIADGHAFPGAFDRYAGSLWVAPEGGVRMAMPSDDSPLDLTGVSNAVTGFHLLMRAGEILNWGAPEGAKAERMARSAAGVSADGRWLYLVVAEGRRTLLGEEGYTEAQMTRFLAGLHCAEALMLDCGGSSALLADLDEKGPVLVNRPEDGKARPVPVLLGVRERITD